MSSDWVSVREFELDRTVVQSTIDSALVSPRLRAHSVLPPGEDGWSRTLIAMMQDSYVPPHVHPRSGELGGRGERLVCLRGRCAVLLFGSAIRSEQAGSGIASNALKLRSQFDAIYLSPESNGVYVAEQTADHRTGGGVRVVRAIEIASGVAHSLVTLSEMAMICEFKTAADFAANRKMLLPDFPQEGHPDVQGVLRSWRQELQPPHAVL